MASTVPLPDSPKVIAVLQAGGKGSRMGVLTRERAKPALPFGGTHQLIDIAMSNLSNSGIADVWVSVQYLAGSLDEHLQHGRPWDLDRNRGGFRRIVPEEAEHEGVGGFSAGNADDLYRIRHHLAAEDADLVVALSADQVFTLDLREVIAEHLKKRSDCTIVTTRVPLAEAANKAVVTQDAAGTVTRIEEKPQDPEHGTISAEVFVYTAGALLRALEAAVQHRAPATDGDDTGLGDVAEHLLPQMIANGTVRTYELSGYWKDMGRPETYLTAHRDLVRGRVPLFENPEWPIRTLATNRGPSRIRDGAVIADSVLAPGCDIAGTVRGSTLGPGVVVRAGAVVEDSVLLAGCALEKEAQARTCLLDEEVTLCAGASVGGTPESAAMRDADIAVVGRGAVIRGRVAPGHSVDPGSTVS